MAYGQINADQISTSVSGYSLGAGNSSLMKNKIINGSMVIDQRNAGAAVTQTTSGGVFGCDRWNIYGTVTSKFSAQQVSTAPAGFVNSSKILSLSAYSSGSSEQFIFRQLIEGYNVADLNWGSANAKTVTISFWVQSSLTGTFGGSVLNSDASRCYPFSFTISVANTWEYKSVTIAGDTTGTWLTTNGIGLNLTFNMGSGSSLLGTAGVWGSTYYTGVTGNQSIVGTSGATFYITGVQLEVGSSATGFEYRVYSTELANCQRYYELIGDVVGGSTAQSFFGDSYTSGGSTAQVNWVYRQQKRAAPTVASYGTYTYVNATGLTFTGNNSILGVCILIQPTSSSAQRSFFYPNAASGVSASAEL